MKIQPLLNLNFNEHQNNKMTQNRAKGTACDNSSLMMDYLTFKAANAKAGVRPAEVKAALKTARKMDTNASLLSVRAQNIAQDANQTLADISNITRSAKREIGSVQALFDKPQKGAILEISTDEDGRSVLKQFKKDGKLVRTGYLHNGKVWRVEKTAKDGTEIDILSDNGQPVMYKEGLKHKGGGKNTADLSIVYLNGEPIGYKENAKFYNNGRITASKKIVFEDGKPVLFAENSIDFADGRHKYSKSLKLKDGKAFEYEENADFALNQGGTSTCYLLLNDDKPVQYDEVCVCDDENNRFASRRLLYEDGNIKTYQVFNPYETNYVKCIDFFEGSPVKYKSMEGVNYKF